MRSKACYLYVLPTASEDHLKVGISHDPLTRAIAFDRRYYEAFDLPRSLLVAFESTPEARTRETALHRKFRELNAGQPLAVPSRAGGHTEWFRGAYAQLLIEVEGDRQQGHVVHAPAARWWRDRLLQERAALYEWGEQWLRDVPDESDWSLRWREIVDVIDAWPALGLSIEGVLPDRLDAWYRRYRSAYDDAARNLMV